MSRTRQSADFRQETVAQLLQIVQAGESASVIGVSGVGKSNLFNHLLDSDVRKELLGGKSADFLFLKVNFHYSADTSLRSIFSLILDSIEALESQAADYQLSAELFSAINRQHDALLDAGDDVLRVQRAFKQAIRTLMRDNPQRQLVFLFDQFDDIYRDAPARLFLNLRGVREAFKYQVSYLVFTRQPLDVLVEEDDKAREEFCELLSTHLLGLSPYVARDAQAMLVRLLTRHGQTLDEPATEKLLTLVSGHGGLLRSCLLAHLNRTVQLDAEQLILDETVAKECKKLWSSLSRDEQQILHLASSQRPIPNALWKSRKSLILKGMLVGDVTSDLFSPLYAAYARSGQHSDQTGLYLDVATRRVYVNGMPTEQLTKTEFLVCQCLFEYEGEVVAHDKLLEMGWPNDEWGTVGNEALTQVMSRLRKKVEPNAVDGNYAYIQTVRSQGYILRIQ